MGIVDMASFWVLLVNALLLVDASSRNMPFAYQNQLQRHCGFTTYTSLCVQNLREFRPLQGLDFVSFLVNKTISDSNMLTSPLSSSMSSSKLVSLEVSNDTLPSNSVSAGTYTTFLHNYYQRLKFFYTKSKCYDIENYQNTHSLLLTFNHIENVGYGDRKYHILGYKRKNIK